RTNSTSDRIIKHWYHCSLSDLVTHALHDALPISLFKRDAHLCMYCGLRFPSSQLSRDHIRPLSQGGRDTWMNVVTACRRCNNLKDRKSTRLNSSHVKISYAVFCLTKKTHGLYEHT